MRKRRNRKWNQRIGGALLAGIMLLALTGCAQKETETEEKTYVWQLGTSSPEDTVTQVFAEKFAEETNRLSDGQMQIEIYPNSTIGNDSELLDCCKEGDIPFVVQNTAPQVSYMPKTAVFDTPCVFDTIEQARDAVDNEPFYEQIETVYEDGGYHLLGIADQGFRVMTANKKIEEISDFKGLKIRTMENANHLAFWQTLGANPTPMAFSEVYIGLQQKTIDAEENPVEVIVSGKLYEQQKYVIETNHLPHYITLIMNDDLFKDITQEQQEILEQATETAVQYAREQADERVADRLGSIEESGTEIVTLSDDVKDDMREEASDLYNEIRNQVGQKLFDLYTE